MQRHRPVAALWDHRLRVLIRPFRFKEQLLPCLYVAGDLDHFEMHAMEAMATSSDYQAPGSDGRMRSWRRLDLHWMAYLHQRIEVATARGPVHPALASRWSSIRAWAEERWSPNRVSTALTMRPDARYRPPALPAAA
jgi:hypothetical protein